MKNSKLLVAGLALTSLYPGNAGAEIRPLTNPGSWVTPQDYPAAALRNEQQGTTGYEVVVDDAGKPTQCTVISSSGFPALDTATCAIIMRRGSFTPGEPDGVFRSSIIWKIPRGPSPQSIQTNH